MGGKIPNFIFFLDCSKSALKLSAVVILWMTSGNDPSKKRRSDIRAEKTATLHKGNLSSTERMESAPRRFHSQVPAQ
jgi:hypothetical protein